MMNVGGGGSNSAVGNGGYGGGYGSGAFGGMGGGGGGSGGGSVGSGGQQVKEEFGIGGGGSYSSFNNDTKTNFTNLPQSNYYSSMR